MLENMVFIYYFKNHVQDMYLQIIYASKTLKSIKLTNLILTYR